MAKRTTTDEQPSRWQSDERKAECYRDAVFCGHLTQQESWRWLAEWQARHPQHPRPTADTLGARIADRSGNPTWTFPSILIAGKEQLRILDAMTEKMERDGMRPAMEYVA